MSDDERPILLIPRRFEFTAEMEAFYALADDIGADIELYEEDDGPLWVLVAACALSGALSGGIVFLIFWLAFG